MRHDKVVSKNASLPAKRYNQKNKTKFYTYD
jgi:hypothetical protein